MTFLAPLGSNSSQPSSVVPPSLETPLGEAFSAALAAAKDKAAGNISSPTSGIGGPPLSSSPSWWQPMPYNYFDLAPLEPTIVAPVPTLPGPTFTGPMFPAKAGGPEEPEPGPEEADPEGPEDSGEPRSPSAAAANYAAQAALYAADADKYASKLMAIVVDVLPKTLPGEEDKALHIYNYFLQASAAARLAQAAAGQAAAAAAEASESPDTADLDTGIAAADAAEALSNRNTAEAAYKAAIDIRRTLTDFRLWGGGSASEPEG
jgi:hypothetical protein